MKTYHFYFYFYYLNFNFLCLEMVINYYLNTHNMYMHMHMRKFTHIDKQIEKHIDRLLEDNGSLRGSLEVLVIRN